MKSYLFVLAVLFFSLFSVSLNAQEGYGDVSTGVKGARWGSTDDNSYSALVIDGPGKPYYPYSKREIVFKFRAAGKSVIRAQRGLSWGSYLQFLTTSPLSTDATPIVRMQIDEDGKVGIGTTSPSHTLTVNGTARFKEVIVDINAGADHVFNSDYDLKALPEIEKYVKENKHLPGIPSEKQMQENGLNMNEFQIKLLQKIEELTLYTIQQQELIKDLQNRVQTLEQ